LFHYLCRYLFGLPVKEKEKQVCPKPNIVGCGVCENWTIITGFVSIGWCWKHEKRSSEGEMCEEWVKKK
jgi:hypothetical protein